jgi:N-acetylmuramoyl-L-alanine amidase
MLFLLVLTAIFVIAAKSEDEPSQKGAVVVTPIVYPTPDPDPTPPPIDIPEGKVMEPVLVVIDAGHGGEDGGTISPYKEGFYEKDITLSMAEKVAEYLKEKGIDVILTRDGDYRFSASNREDLLTRANIANENKASLFVSIHVNAYDLKYAGAAAVNGMEVYYMEKDGVYTEFTDERFAQLLNDEIVKANGIKSNGVKQNNYSVLRNTQMPAVLIETAYITNKEDHARLASEEFRSNTARGIVQGIELALKEIDAFEYNGDMYVFKEAKE